MSLKLPVHNSQTSAEFLNLHQNQISEEDSDESCKFAFDEKAFLARRESLGIRFSETAADAWRVIADFYRLV